MKTKSKRFWLNLLTMVTIVGASLADAPLSPLALEIAMVTVAVANIVLQTWFNTEETK